MKQIDFDYFFPANFFDKTVNEPFNCFLIRESLGLRENKVKYGDPNKKEPDILIGNIPFELTLASDRTATLDYIKDIREHKLQTDNIEDVSICCIRKACEKKSKKQYITKGNSVSIVLTMPVFVWSSATYSKIPELLPPTRFLNLMQEVKEQYISSDIFEDVLIHMPGFAYDWITYSCKSLSQIGHRLLTDKEIYSKQYPYVIKK